MGHRSTSVNVMELNISSYRQWLKLLRTTWIKQVQTESNSNIFSKQSNIPFFTFSHCSSKYLSAVPLVNKMIKFTVTTAWVHHPSVPFSYDPDQCWIYANPILLIHIKGNTHGWLAGISYLKKKKSFNHSVTVYCLV